MRELIFPNMSEVHPALAEDMEWVKKEWITRARNLLSRKDVEREFAFNCLIIKARFVSMQIFQPSQT